MEPFLGDRQILLLRKLEIQGDTKGPKATQLVSDRAGQEGRQPTAARLLVQFAEFDPDKRF